jgi:hypothetical protein
MEAVSDLRVTSNHSRIVEAVSETRRYFLSAVGLPAA